MKVKLKHIIVLFFLLLSASVSNAQTIIGYSNLFSFNTTGTQPIIGYSNPFEFNTTNSQLVANFVANLTNVAINQTVQFTDQSTSNQTIVSYAWDFGAGANPQSLNTKGPHNVQYTSAGKKTVKLTIKNSAGTYKTTVKEQYISVAEGTYGIAVKVFKTNPTAAPNLAYVGYSYTYKSGSQSVTKQKYFPIEQNITSIHDFPTQASLPNGAVLTSAFNNELLLFDNNKNQVGHIYFEYNPAKEKIFQREAYLYLHNDNSFTGDQSYPYTKNSPQYDKSWDYYSIGEYPVSMLIPPDNRFSAIVESKKPVLLVHGWEGRMRLITDPDGVINSTVNETSYWLDQSWKINEKSNSLQAWQFYYPYNSAHKHLAVCLKNGVERLSAIYNGKKVGIVTHSMGGLVTLRYLIEYQSAAKTKVSKVLFNAPPAHGSLGANLYYKTTLSFFLEGKLKYDRHAPSVRDMKLGSDATWFIHSGSLPTLENGNIGKDYFVLLGTTWKKFSSDISGICAHQEALDHHDGIVAISSGSLLDKGVGFATFHGNHDDAIHMQSKIRNNSTQQNIGQPYLLPDIIDSYFNQSYESFLNVLSAETAIKTIVKPNGTVIKPNVNSISEIPKSNNVNFQKGIINIELSQNRFFSTYPAVYSSTNRRLILSPILNLLPNFLFKGVFKQNTDSEGKRRYYFNDDNTNFKSDTDPRAVYNGCAIDLLPGQNTIILQNLLGITQEVRSFDFKYSQTNNVQLVTPPNKEIGDDPENYTDTKEQLIALSGTMLSDSLTTPFFVDDQTTSIDFHLMNFDAVDFGFEPRLKMKLPDQSTADTSFAGSTYVYNPVTGSHQITIPSPMPGKWQLWLETDYPGADTMNYQSVAVLKSGIYSYLPEARTLKFSPGKNNLIAALKVPDFSLVSSLKVFAKLHYPNGQIQVFDISSNFITQDTTYLFQFSPMITEQGEYLIKYNIDGIYNGFNFERCLYQSLTIENTEPKLMLPDISLNQQQPQTSLNLLNHVYNVDADTLLFNYQILQSNIDLSALDIVLDSLYKVSFYSHLADTGSVRLSFNCYFEDKMISDTMLVQLRLPDLFLTNVSVPDTMIRNHSNFKLNYAVLNQGNHHASAYKARYYLSATDSLTEDAAYLGEKIIYAHEKDSILQVSDELTVPLLYLIGPMKLFVFVDADHDLAEISEQNNLAYTRVFVNPLPPAPVIIAGLPGNESATLSWMSNFDPMVSSYLIRYGTSPDDMNHQIFTLNSDTTYTINGLVNETTYWFQVCSMKIMGHYSD